MNPLLIGFHQSTYDAVFRHPAVRNLAWRDARSMLASLVEPARKRTENLKVTRNGQTLFLHPSLNKNL